MYVDSLYHKVLRVSVLLVALMLLFQVGFLTPGTGMLLESRTYVANVIGISAGVESTDLSRFTAELTKKQTALDAREAALKEREINARAVDQNASFDISNYLLSATLLLLLCLILMNYIFDFIRARKASQEKYAAVA